MPQQQYYQQYCNTNVTTNYYVPTWGSNATTITNQWYQPVQYQTYQPIITSTGADQVWYTWVTMGNSTMTCSPNYTFRQETPEERARVLAERERADQERVAARTRARILLEDFLNDDQKVELEKKGRFHVTGSKGRRYCIRATGQAGNVDLLKPDGGVQATLCCHPRGYLPEGDAWLMQMIELRNDEEHFLATANVHRGSLPVAV